MIAERRLAEPPESPAPDRLESEALALLRRRAPSWPPEPDAHWLGAAYQQALDESARSRARSRRSRGVFYTPPELVRHVLSRTLDPLLADPCRPIPRLLDPACGCGAFLIEAARRIRELRPDAAPAEILLALHGVDIDPVAASLCRLALWLELGAPDEPLDAPAAQVRVADGLLDPQPDPPFDAVIGNPPFLSQLSAATARDRSSASALRRRFGASLRAYTDPAALFLQGAVESVRDGGRVGMILPVSILASRDVAPIRRRVASLAAIRSLWLDTDGLFDAGVRTVALSAERGAAQGEVERSSGTRFHRRAPSAATVRRPEGWSLLAADLAGVPPVSTGDAPRLADLAEITAGFRDEYYAVARRLREHSGGAAGDELPVVTVGMIDVGRSRWGERPARVGGRAWRRPVVAHDDPDPKLASVIAQQRRPKLLVATQTKVIEVAPDPQGIFVGITPTILVFPRDRDDLWRIAAALASPVLSAWVAAEAFGAARSLDAIKPSASLLRAAPLPTHPGPWTEAARLFEALSAADADPTESRLEAFGLKACGAYGLTEMDAAPLLAWWLPRVRPSSPRARLRRREPETPSHAPVDSGAPID